RLLRLNTADVKSKKRIIIHCRSPERMHGSAARREPRRMVAPHSCRQCILQARWRTRDGGRIGLMLDHLSIQCADLGASAAFYDAALAPLGGQRVMDFGEAIGYGVPPMPDFWIGRQATGDGFRESHIAFSAPSRAAVRAFF